MYMVKLLVTILTSSRLDFLKVAVNSVKTQINTALDYTYYIIVNTLDDNYYLQVKNHFKRENIIRTESNGKPGKGHNSAIKFFQSQKKYDYLVPIDGDDFLYPCALNRLEIYLSYKPDILAVPYTDNITRIYGATSLSYPIDKKCYLRYNNHVLDMKKSWMEDKLSPFDNNINNINLAGRIIFLSRKALEMNIQYDEMLSCYDDLYPILQLLEEVLIPVF